MFYVIFFVLAMILSYYS